MSAWIRGPQAPSYSRLDDLLRGLMGLRIWPHMLLFFTMKENEAKLAKGKGILEEV